VYAREVTEVIRDFAQKHNLPYRIYPIGLALKKHYNLLKSNALAS
jgi:linoleoyl-CoA desaturase